MKTTMFFNDILISYLSKMKPGKESFGGKEKVGYI